MGRSSDWQASSKDFTSIVPPPAKNIADFRLPIAEGELKESPYVLSIVNRRSAMKT
jgi:hypothetical protein